MWSTHPSDRLHRSMMSTRNLHDNLLRPSIVQILRAAGFHSARPSALDSLTDLAVRYISLLAASTVDHAENSHEYSATPQLDDVRMALYEAGALRPQMSQMEEQLRGEEDMRGLEVFLGWFNGPMNKEIRRIAGFIASQGDVVDTDSLPKEDYLSALKKKHSKTGEESRFQGTALGKDAEPRRIVIEGGANSIQEWATQLRPNESSQTVGTRASSTTMSSMASMSPPEDMDI